MLPATLSFIIAMIASALTDRLTRKMDYRREEQRILMELLHEATGKRRFAFTADHRRRLAIKGKELTAKERKACCHLVRSETILACMANLLPPCDRSRRRTVGRPRMHNDIRNLVIRLANENLGWGYTKVRDALRGLKIEIGRTTVADILAEAGLEPAPERIQKMKLWTSRVSAANFAILWTENRGSEQARIGQCIPIAPAALEGQRYIRRARGIRSTTGRKPFR